MQRVSRKLRLHLHRAPSRSSGVTSTVRFQKASVSPLKWAFSKLRSTFCSGPSGSFGFTLYSVLPGGFGCTSTVRFQKAMVSPLQSAFRKLRLHLVQCTSRKLRFYVYSEPSFRKLRFHLYGTLPGSFGFTSTVSPQKTLALPFTVHFQKVSASPLQ